MPQKNSHLTPAILEMRSKGATYREIRDALGVSINQVMYWCNPKVREQRIAEATRRAARKRAAEAGTVRKPRPKAVDMFDRMIEFRMKATAARRARKAIERAKSRGKEFTLSNEEIDALVNQTSCARTGIMFDPEGEFSMSVDRIDPGKGYVTGNVQAVCWMYNRAKGASTDAAVLAMARALAAANPEIEWD